MKKLTLILFTVAGLLSTKAHSQADTNTPFKPAAATQNHYDALYVLSSSDDKKIKGILRNIKNALTDPRIEGKLHIELIAFGDGVELYRKTNDYLSLITPLKDMGVDFVQCSHTIQERKIDKTELFDFISYVPSANGEIILRHYQGWAVVHP